MSGWRRALRFVHLWLAFVLCLPLVLIGLSGSALLVQREVLRLTGPSARASGEVQPIEKMIAAARGSVSPEARAAWVDLPLGPGGVATVQFEIGRRPTRRFDVAVDPVSLEVLGASEYVRRGPVKSVLVELHEYLLLPSHIGFVVVGWMGVALTFMVVSGLVLWWPRGGQWRDGFLLRRGLRGAALHLGLHRVIGIWGLAVLFALCISGLYLTFPKTFTAAVKSVLSDEMEDMDFAQSGHSGPLGHDQAVSAAKAVVADGFVTGLQLPGAAGSPYVVQLEPAGLTPSQPPIMVTIDPATAEITYIEDPRLLPPAERVLNMMHALHFSLGLGRVWTFLVFLSGLLPLVLTVTGVSVWWRRRAR